MRYKIARTKRFKTAYKRVSQYKNFDPAIFIRVVSALASGETLDRKYKDHKLSGKMKNFRECHLAPDILLLYEIDGGNLILTLVSIGNHSQIFKS